MRPATSRGELAPRTSRPWRVAARVLAHTALPAGASFTFSQSRAVRLLLPPRRPRGVHTLSVTNTSPAVNSGQFVVFFFLDSPLSFVVGF